LGARSGSLIETDCLIVRLFLAVKACRVGMQMQRVPHISGTVATRKQMRAKGDVTGHSATWELLRGPPACLKE
jgi:hypothetical protein